MPHGVLTYVLPVSQRRTLDQLTADLDLGAGEVKAKRSAFWTMLVLSAIIASAGIITDSTATVIGAMIIAPLSTPIMAVALGLTRGTSALVWRSALFVLGGMVVVVALGAAVSAILPASSGALVGNSQITGRTSPGIFDLVTALATGFAGSIALARRDVAAILPGVAIAISLVPPLAVVGVCLGHGSYASALGALFLFLSNLVSMVLAGTLTFTAAGYKAEVMERRARRDRRTSVGIGLLLVLVALPLVGNSVFTAAVSTYARHAEQVADDWVAATPGASVSDVSVVGRDLRISIQTPDGAIPSTQDLLDELDARTVPGLHVTVVTTFGQTVDVGTTG
ncbi:TIGR00341 family protein [Luteimicrobium sp. DT211]|uniref:TIGR00341 family protein n=1 Tax=Luteimicrobium sp. DT211 TaxID=3393412 RepID=UPI003CF6614D